MKTINILLALLPATVFFACSPEKKKNDILIQANHLHIESVAIHAEVTKELAAIKLATPGAKSEKALDSLNRLLKIWEQSLVEVPGFEHDHEGHDHHHNAAPKMTDQSMLEYQQNTKDAIEDLSKALKDI
jgi:hypothetical protein